MDLSTLWNGLYGLLGIIFGGLITARVRPAGSRENTLIDQLQQELGKEQTARERLEKKVDALSKEVATLSLRASAAQLERDLWQFQTIRVETQILDLGQVPLPRPSGLPQRVDVPLHPHGSESGRND